MGSVADDAYRRGLPKSPQRYVDSRQDVASNRWCFMRRSTQIHDSTVQPSVIANLARGLPLRASEVLAARARGVIATSGSEREMAERDR